MTTSAPWDRRAVWFSTYTGRRFFPFEPRPVDVAIEDVAHALAHIGRFNGHTRGFYSVAAHSLHVSMLVPAADAFAGLMHDAAEAYVGDLIRPIKLVFPDFAQVEAGIYRAIALRFGLEESVPPAVHAADDMALHTEARDLFEPAPEWAEPRRADRMRTLEPSSPGADEAAFLARFAELWGAVRVGATP